MRKVPDAFNRICSVFREDFGNFSPDVIATIRGVVLAHSTPEERPELKAFVDYVLNTPLSERDMEILYYKNSPDYDFIPISGFYILLGKALEQVK